MQMVDLQQIGDELAIKWSDHSESFIKVTELRRACPCAVCKGEVDVMGQLHKGPERPLTPASFRLVDVRRVGGYALEPVWADGHNTGLFTFGYLKALGDGSLRVGCCSETEAGHGHAGHGHHHHHHHSHGHSEDHEHGGHHCRCKHSAG